MQKGFAPILILVGIVVIIGVAAGAYFFGKSQVPKPQNQVVVSPTPQPTISAGNPAPTDTDETANWKTYTDPQIGYSIKYPKGWYLREIDRGAIIENKKREPPDTPVGKETPIDPIYFNVNITTYEKEPTLSLKDWIINVWDRMKEIAKEPLKPEQLITMTIDTIQGYKLEYRSPQWIWIEVFLENKGEAYTISAVLDYPGEEAIFDQILSTFKFTN